MGKAVCGVVMSFVGFGLFFATPWTMADWQYWVLIFPLISVGSFTLGLSFHNLRTTHER